MKKALIIVGAIALLSIAGNVLFFILWTPNVTIHGKNGYTTKLNKILDATVVIYDKGNIKQVKSLGKLLSENLKDD